MHFGADCTDGDAGGIVADPAVFDDADVDFDNVAILNDAAGPANAVDHLLIDGDADLAGESFVAKERTAGARIGHKLGCSGVDLCGADAGTDQGYGFE